MKCLKVVLGLVAAAVIVAGSIVYGGLVNVAGDEHHSRTVYRLLETVREESISVRSRRIAVPALDSPHMIASGAADYNDMCSGCHLRPGTADTEIRAALYPQPPDLTRVRRADPAQTFWIIKHGIKMSGMPAWGKTHDDARIWAMVAFLQYLPRVTPEQYEILVARDITPDVDESVEPAASATNPMAATSPELAVDEFIGALSRGDATIAQQWLLPSVSIFEGGTQQTSRSAYARDHMTEDMKFLSNHQLRRISRSSGEVQSAAWVSTYYRITGGGVEGRPAALSDETVILARTPEGWRIRHIHWCSRSE